MGCCASKKPVIYPEDATGPNTIFKVLVGPVVGTVNCYGGRILLETNLPGDVELVAKAKRNIVERVNLTLRGYTPTIFEFRNLTPDTKYTVDIIGPEPQPFAKKAFLKTQPLKRVRPLRFATVSCNDAFADNVWGGINMWKVLLKQIKRGKVDAVLHCGDQVYLDHKIDRPKTLARQRRASLVKTEVLPVSSTIRNNLAEVTEKPERSHWLEAIAFLDRRTEEEWNKERNTILDLFRGAYRLTWSRPSTAAVLARVPNCMVMDDHEIVDNWGDHPEHNFVMRPREELRRAFPDEPDEWILERRKEFFCAKCAWEVCCQYQYALRPNYSDNPYDIDPVYFDTWGNVGVLMLETRSPTTFLEKDSPLTASGVKEEMLGRRQLEMIEHELFAPDGRFGPASGIRNMIVVSPVPFAFIPEPMNQTLQSVQKDLLGHWSSKRASAELRVVLKMFHKWVNVNLRRGENIAKENTSVQPSDEIPTRQITLVGGDIHCGLISRIYDQEEENLNLGVDTTGLNPRTGFDQLISSPIRNKNLPSFIFTFSDVFTKTIYRGCLCEGFRVRHIEFVETNNFGVIDISSGECTCMTIDNWEGNGDTMKLE